MKKHLAVMVALSVMLGVGTPVVKDIVEPTKVEASSFSYTQDQQQALNYINEVRRGMGLQQVTLDPFLTEAAQNHAEYIQTNGNRGSTMPKQERGKPGFLGETFKDRLAALGSSSKGVGEYIDTKARTTKEGVDRLLYGPYHRTGLTDPGVTQVGLGKSGNGLVLLSKGEGYPEGFGDIVYPYNGQKGVGVEFLGDELPNPLEQFGNVGRTGYVISYTPEDLRTLESGTQKFTLKDSKGNVVPHYMEESSWGVEAHFFPKKALKYGETYTAKFEFVYQDTGKKGSKTWSFTTQTKDGNTVTPKPTEPTKPTPTPNKTVYADFNPNAYWADNMLWAIDRGLMSGYKDVKNPKTGKLENQLRPNNNLTESQLLTVLFRYTNPTEFQNTKGSGLTPAYQLANKYKLPTKSTVNNSAHAHNPVTRGLVAQIMATKHFGELVDEKTAVQFFIDSGMTSMGDYKAYNPDGNVTRAHIVTFMKNYDTFLNSDKKNIKLNRVYTDFNPNAYWSDNMLWAIEKGMISGYTNVKNNKTGKTENLLKPNNNLTEAQFVSVLFRYAQPEQMNTLQPINGWWASTGYQLADQYNIPTKGSANSTANSGHQMTRGEVAVAIATLHHGRVMSERDAVQFMYRAGISSGYQSGITTYENFGAKNKLTRAHIVTFIKNYDTYMNRGS